jgi:hypothetical protein
MSQTGDRSIVILPLTPPSEGEVTDFSYLAASKHMFMRPQPLFTYGQCVAYSDGTAERLVAVGESVKFPSASNYLVSTDKLMGLIRTSVGPEVQLLISDNVPAKRPCVRLLGVGGQTKRYVHLYLGSRRSKKTDEK